MKKILFLSSFALMAGLNAQTLTQANNAPASGDTYSTYQVDSTGLTPGGSGSSVTWNFSSINTHSTILSNYVCASNSNGTYPSANVAVAASTSNVSYYNSGVNALYYYGGVITVASNAVNLVFAAPAPFAKYPMSLGTNSAAAISGSVTAMSLNGTFTGNATTLLDGTGTLSLPSMTFANVTRVVNSQTLNANMGITTATINQITYSFYSPLAKAAIFSIATSTLSSPMTGVNSSTVVTLLKNYIAVGINEAKASIVGEIKAFPNPANSSFQIVTANPISANVQVLDITGKVVLNETLSNGKTEINTLNLNAGIYIYKIIDNNGAVISINKFTVAH
ncbi:MAG: T9SS type A sorting domain-containing protein [Bacteroidetes bacterium]|nr:T9SS type A sorting domain-containing protein [Bacteroidota bacterium]